MAVAKLPPSADRCIPLPLLPPTHTAPAQAPLPSILPLAQGQTSSLCTKELSPSSLSHPSLSLTPSFSCPLYPSLCPSRSVPLPPLSHGQSRLDFCLNLGPRVLQNTLSQPLSLCSEGHSVSLCLSMSVCLSVSLPSLPENHGAQVGGGCH